MNGKPRIKKINEKNSNIILEKEQFEKILRGIRTGNIRVSGKSQESIRRIVRKHVVKSTANQRISCHIEVPVGYEVSLVEANKKATKTVYLTKEQYKALRGVIQRPIKKPVPIPEDKPSDNKEKEGDS